MARTYNFPVYATQGGGLAREVGGKLIFVEKPNCPGLDVGDEVPQEWGLVPANGRARQKEIDADMANVDPALIGMFQTILDGRMTWDQAKPYIPSHMHAEIKRGLGLD